MNGSHIKDMGINGTFQLKREYFESAKQLEKDGAKQHSTQDSDMIGAAAQWKKRTSEGKNLVCAIDVGTVKSGYVIGRALPSGLFEISKCGIVSNNEILDLFYQDDSFDAIAMENFQSMGMSVGKSVFDSCIWLGRFIQEARRSHPALPVWLLHRTTVKSEICGSSRAKDKNVRQAIIDLYPAGNGGGKCPQIGLAKQKGMLYGVSSHMWSALGVAISFDKITR
tara:strand:- start:273 stop:944 length:672 start_codon:yes stop_codon:yes gene_type:complete